MVTRECPRCGAAIEPTNTATVCRPCMAKVAQSLRFLPGMLAELEHTITYGTVTDVHRGPGTVSRPFAMEGPWCPAFDGLGRPVEVCPHTSCHQAFDSQDAAARFEDPRREPPLPHEGRMPFSVEAVEVRDVAVQTIRAWASTVPVPLDPRVRARPRPRRRTGAREGIGAPLPPAKDRPTRCICCDLPLYSCHRHRSEISS